MIRTIEIDGLHVGVRTWGEEGSPPVLYWHGAGDSSSQFEQPAHVLADEQGLYVVAPDAPGHGRTSALAPEEYLPSRMADLAAALLDRLDLGPVVFAGFSWGAAVACRFAAAHPERTRALVLVEGGYLDFRDLPDDVTPPSLEQAVAEHGIEGAMHWGGLVQPTAESWPSLAEHGIPVLVLTALRDATVKRLGFDPIARFVAAVPQAEVRRLAPTGHDLIDSNPRNVARLGAEWLLDRGLVT